MPINGELVTEPGHYSVFNAGKRSHCCLVLGEKAVYKQYLWRDGILEGKNIYLL